MKKRFQKTFRVLIVTILILLILLFIFPFFIPVPPLGKTQSVYDLAASDSQFIGVRGIDIHYKELGSGEEVLILLHGFGASLFSWRDVMKDLSIFGRVIAYDRPAFGLTERPVYQSPVAFNHYANDNQPELLISFMDALDIDEAILIGHSAGGTLAVKTALKYPERVKSLVLVAPAILRTGGIPGFLKPIFKLPQVNRIGPLFSRFFINRAGRILEISWFDPSLITNEILEGYRKPLTVDNWDVAFWEFLKNSSQNKLDNKLINITQSVLVITGDNDRIVSPDDSKRVAESIPNARLADIRNCGHLPQEEKPEEFSQIVTEFLKNFE